MDATACIFLFQLIVNYWRKSGRSLLDTPLINNLKTSLAIIAYAYFDINIKSITSAILEVLDDASTLWKIVKLFSNF